MRTIAKLTGYTILAILASIRWTLNLTLGVIDAVGSHVAETMIDERKAPTSPQARHRMVKRASAKSEPKMVEPEEIEEEVTKPSNLVSLRSTGSSSEGKKAQLIVEGWKVVQDMKKDGMAVLSNGNEEMIVNTRTWDPIGKVSNDV
jgi:hypothetical protein